MKRILSKIKALLPRVRVSLEWPKPPVETPAPTGAYWVFYEPYYADGVRENLHSIGVHYAESLSADGLMPSLMETEFFKGLKTGRKGVPDSIHQGVVNILALPAAGYPTEHSVLAESYDMLWSKGELWHFGPDFKMYSGNTYAKQRAARDAAERRFRGTHPRKSAKFLH